MPAAAPPASARSAAPSPAGPGRERTDSGPPSAGSATATPAAAASAPSTASAASAASAAAPAAASGEAALAAEGGRGAGLGRDLTSEEGAFASEKRAVTSANGSRRGAWPTGERRRGHAPRKWRPEPGCQDQHPARWGRGAGRFAGTGSSLCRSGRWAAGHSLGAVVPGRRESSWPGARPRRQSTAQGQAGLPRKLGLGQSRSKARKDWLRTRFGRTPGTLASVALLTGLPAREA